MAIGVGASGYVGVAVETVSGTYVAPTHYMLLRNETLKYTQATIWRRPLRGIADIAGPVPGYAQVDGDIEVELTEDIHPQIMRSARGTIVKTGVGPWTYTFTPSAVAIPAKTMSITVVRNGIVFGYTKCIVTSQEYTMNNGILVARFGILGADEASQGLPTPTYVTTAPYGAGQYSLEIPSGTPVTDTDTFTLTIDDNGTQQYRIKSSRAAQFAFYGERTTQLRVDRDFESRAEYDAFKALTAKAIKLVATKDANNSISFDVKRAITDTYEVSGLSGQAELIRAAVQYNGVYDDATSKPYEIIMKSSTADITVP